MIIRPWGKVIKHILNNVASQVFFTTICQNGIENEKVPPCVHRHVVAKNAISTFKDHFHTILVGLDFPDAIVIQLLAHAENTLNMMRPTNIALTISACPWIYGQHDLTKCH